MSIRNGFLTHSRLAGLVAVAAMAVAAALLSTAGAVVTYETTGTPGTADIPQTQAWVNYTTYPQISLPARYSYRSPGYTGTQTIWLKYGLLQWNASDQNYEAYQATSRISGSALRGRS